MDKEIIKFCDTEIELFLKHKFNRHKNLILIYDVDINNGVVSSKFLLGEKSFHWLQSC